MVWLRHTERMKAPKRFECKKLAVLFIHNKHQGFSLQAKVEFQYKISNKFLMAQVGYQRHNHKL